MTPCFVKVTDFTAEKISKIRQTFDFLNIHYREVSDLDGKDVYFHFYGNDSLIEVSGYFVQKEPLFQNFS